MQEQYGAAIRGGGKIGKCDDPPSGSGHLQQEAGDGRGEVETHLVGSIDISWNIRFVPEGLGYKTDLFEEEPEKKKDDVDSGPEEEEVTKNMITFPGLVDKQAQLTVPWQLPKNRAGKSANPDLSFYPGANERLPEEAVQPDPGREEQEQAWRQETLIENVSDPFTCPWLVPVVKVVKYRKTVCPRAAWFRATVRVIVEHHRTIFLAFLSLSTDLCLSPVTLVKTENVIVLSKVTKTTVI